MKLIEYKDKFVTEPFWLWVNDKDKALSPSFSSQKKAEKWMDRILLEFRKKVKRG